MGLNMFHCQQIRVVLKDDPPTMLNAYLMGTTKVFDFFLLSLGVENADKPITKEALMNPYSSEICILLYLYSIEPPFYAALNSACRNLDHSLLSPVGLLCCWLIGPFARVLGPALASR